MNQNTNELFFFPKLSICIMLVFFSLTCRAETVTGFINYGAVVLDSQPDKESGQYNRVGYLPIGAVVSYNKNIPHRDIFNHSEKIQDTEYYVEVKSNLGFTGLVRHDQITLFGVDTLLVPLRYKLYVRDVKTNEVIGKLNRAENLGESMPVKVVGKDDNFYIVELIGVKHKDKEGNFTFNNEELPVEGKYLDEAGNIRGKIHKMMVKKDKFVKLDPLEYKKFPEVNVRGYSGFNKNEVNGLIKKLTNKIDSEALNKIISHLQVYGDLQCRISAEADADINAKFLGTGFGFNVKFLLAGEDSVFSMGSVSYISNEEKATDYYQAADVECEHGNPSRLRTIAYLNTNDPTKNFHIKKEQLPDELKNNWKTFNTKEAYKMINISGLNDYNLFMKHIEDAEFFDSMSQNDRLVMKHVLLKEIANFRTPRD